MFPIDSIHTPFSFGVSREELISSSALPSRLDLDSAEGRRQYEVSTQEKKIRFEGNIHPKYAVLDIGSAFCVVFLSLDMPRTLLQICTSQGGKLC